VSAFPTRPEAPLSPNPSLLDIRSASASCTCFQQIRPCRSQTRGLGPEAAPHRRAVCPNVCLAAIRHTWRPRCRWPLASRMSAIRPDYGGCGSRIRLDRRLEVHGGAAGETEAGDSPPRRQQAHRFDVPRAKIELVVVRRRDPGARHQLFCCGLWFASCGGGHRWSALTDNYIHLTHTGAGRSLDSR
jgi:hypothetical protein